MKTEKRKAKVGEKVIVVNDSLSFGNHTIGDILIVETSLSNGSIYVDSAKNAIFPHEYEVIIGE